VVRRYAQELPVQLPAAGSPSQGHLPGEGMPGSGADGPRCPRSFHWHGRRYAVRVVLARWRERRPWWREALDPAPGQPHGIAAAACERWVWRVEAAPGPGDGPGPSGNPRAGASTGATGVFEIACEVGLDGPGRWQLVRVLD
jgi:hypothetical protein